MNRSRHRCAHRRPPGGSARSALHAVLVAVCALVFLSRPAFADCFDSAASYQGVSATILRAIAWVESRGNPAAEHRNANGSVDIGELQINSVHLRELAPFGIGVLALHDECVNVYVAAWHLKKKMIKYGNNWDAIGAYHSETPRQRDAYARSIKATLVRWGVFPLSR